MNVLTEIRQGVEKYYQIAETKFNQKFPRSPIFFNLQGSTAGQFVFKGKQTKLRFNVKIAKAQPGAFLARTVGHEVAHAIQHWLYTDKGITNEPHGKEWKSIMVVFGLVPSVRHKYDVTDAVRNTKPYTYQCTCCSRIHHFGPKRHKNEVKTPGYYRCRCSGRLEYNKKINRKELRETMNRGSLRETNLDDL